jgi:hypothetical protein
MITLACIVGYLALGLFVVRWLFLAAEQNDIEVRGTDIFWMLWFILTWPMTALIFGGALVLEKCEEVFGSNRLWFTWRRK